MARPRVYVETTIPSFYHEMRTTPDIVARRQWTRPPLLPIESAITEIVQAYIRHRVMPTDPAGDALHLALASYHKCDFLVTWNCQHLANANKFDHIRRVNTLLGLFVPALVTPLELLGGGDEPASE